MVTEFVIAIRCLVQAWNGKEKETITTWYGTEMESYRGVQW